MPQVYRKTDARLIEEIRAGDATAFNDLFKRHWKVAYVQAFKRLQSHEKAQEITQEIFCKLWVNRASLQIENLSAYLYTAVRNRVLNQFEKDKRFVHFEPLLDQLTSQSDAADCALRRDQFLMAYKKLLQTLPDKRQKIFTAYYERGKSTEEIANEFMISRKTVLNQLARAVTQLKTGLSHLMIALVLLGLLR